MSEGDGRRSVGRNGPLGGFNGDADRDEGSDNGINKMTAREL